MISENPFIYQLRRFTAYLRRHTVDWSGSCLRNKTVPFFNHHFTRSCDGLLIRATQSDQLTLTFKRAGRQTHLHAVRSSPVATIWLASSKFPSFSSTPDRPKLSNINKPSRRHRSAAARFAGGGGGDELLVGVDAAASSNEFDGAYCWVRERKEPKRDVRHWTWEMTQRLQQLAAIMRFYWTSIGCRTRRHLSNETTQNGRWLLLSEYNGRQFWFAEQCSPVDD